MAQFQNGGTWYLKNLDPVVHALRTKVGRGRPGVTRRFLRFAAEVGAVYHPCDPTQPYVTRLLMDGSWFVLHLSHGWHVNYQVLPNCGAVSGEVAFSDPSRIEGVPDRM